ncbi:MAG: hypothetical protein JF565_13325 [Propionibacteriales bacterium]|nr:hypothetical protein [Propionibacteriales bacterium]
MQPPEHDAHLLAGEVQQHGARPDTVVGTAEVVGERVEHVGVVAVGPHQVDEGRRDVGAADQQAFGLELTGIAARPAADLEDSGAGAEESREVPQGTRQPVRHLGKAGGVGGRAGLVRGEGGGAGLVHRPMSWRWWWTSCRW